MQNIKLNPEIKKNIVNAIKETNMFVAGELHGAKNNVAVYEYLMNTFPLSGLALEWPKEYGNKLEKYLSNTIDNEELFENVSKDGRFSLEILKLLRKLKTKNRVRDIIFFDLESDYVDWDTRDKLMANEIIKKCKNGENYLVIAGNLHTQKESFKDAYEGDIKIPMGKHLVNHFGNYPLVNIRYNSGKIYNNGITELTKQKAENTDEIIDMGDNNYEIVLEKAVPIDYSPFE